MPRRSLEFADQTVDDKQETPWFAQPLRKRTPPTPSTHIGVRFELYGHGSVESDDPQEYRKGDQPESMDEGVEPVAISKAEGRHEHFRSCWVSKGLPSRG